MSDPERFPFQTGKPTEGGLYVGYSSLPERMNDHEKPSLYVWLPKVGAFQHHSGFYDHGITHWLKLDVPQGGDDAG